MTGDGVCAQDRGALASGILLIATQNLDGTSFARTVILVTHYAPTGAMGIAVNRMSGYPVSHFFDGGLSEPLLLGGPVRPSALFVLARDPKSKHRTHVVDDVYLIAGPGAHVFLKENPNSSKGEAWRAYAGYSGWAAGQLDAEIDRGDWVILPSGVDHVFRGNVDSMWSTLSQLAKARWI